MPKSNKSSRSDMIENQEHFEKLSKTSNPPTYVLVRRVDTKQLMFIPLSWMHRPSCAQKATPKKVLHCYYSNNVNDLPWFRGNLTEVNVIKVLNGNFIRK